MDIKSLNIEVAPKIVFEDFGNEVVLINLTSGNYYSLTGISVILWKSIEEKYCRENLALAIAKHYNEEAEQVKNDCISFFGALEKEKLIVITENGLDGSQNPQKYPEEGLFKEFESYKAPELETYEDMQDLILLDPIHEVDESGWPNVADEEDKEEK